MPLAISLILVSINSSKRLTGILHRLRFESCDLTHAPPALERRLIIFLKAQEKAS
jgi:hypothetical protein